MIGSEPSSGQHTMDMRMKQQSLIPCVQHAEEPDLRSEMARIKTIQPPNPNSKHATPGSPSMSCFSINLFTILPDSATHVITALRRGGLFAELKKQIPGHIGCSILESDLTTDLYLVIDFWQSPYDFLRLRFHRSESYWLTLWIGWHMPTFKHLDYQF